ncbi:MAG: Bifunctional NAD(P)H-hydrate repair enzyme [Thermoleophilia bacterium]|nr:Bifunctional NAD(P)H-hydrate repair enzyme [Thermoleophilia bacterium]
MHHLPGVVPLYSAVEMRTVDRVAVDEIGIPGAVLMERAGLGAAAEILQWFPAAQRIAVVCGSGNNGGDGFVAARHLAAAGRQVEVLLVEGESKVRREPRAFLEVLKHLDIPVRRVNVTAWRSAFDGIDLIVDAMLGTGVSGAPKPPFEAAIRAIGSSLLPVVALDMPSGVDASDGTIEGAAIEADLTITFHAPKIGLAVAPGRFHAGRVKAIDVGIPHQVDEPVRQGLATPALLAMVPPRSRRGSKYDATVAAIGGSVGMVGAISLTAQAAMRAGAGVCWAAVPDRIAEALDVAVPEVQFRGFHGDERGRLTVAAAERLEEIVERADAVVFGPGIGDSDQIRALARWAVRSARVLVLDAQGISAFAGDTQAIAARDGLPTLLTPHEGELGRLLGITSDEIRGNRLKYVREAALQTQATVLLKGEDTIVCLPGGDFLVCRGHRAQATSGTGDVLAGVAGALLARGLDPALAGASAAIACSIAAGQAASDMCADGVIASDLLARIPAALSGAIGGGDE